jgi:hypothetical protein
MFAQHERKSGAAHGLTARIQKQRGVARGPTDREPLAQDRPAFFPEWEPRFAAALALDSDAGPRIEAHVLDPEADEF